MANAVDQNPLILDTASTTAVLVTGFFKIKKVRWFGAANTNTAIIKNKNGVTIWSDAWVTGQNSVDSDLGEHPCDGLIMHTLGGGTIHLYYEGPTPLKTT